MKLERSFATTIASTGHQDLETALIIAVEPEATLSHVKAITVLEVAVLLDLPRHLLKDLQTRVNVKALKNKHFLRNFPSNH